jgi:energy-coupling factor transport system permease protein
MKLNVYEDRGTVLHRLDPRAKLIAMLMGAMLALVFNDPRYNLVVLAGVLFTAYAGKAGRTVLRGWPAFLLFFMVTFVMWQFYLPQTPTAVTIGPVHFAADALEYGFASALRVVTLLCLSIVFLSCVSTEDVTVGLLALRFPFLLVFVLSTALRLVPLFVATASTILEAQVARGLDLSLRNPWRRLRQVVAVAVPLVMSTLRHADRLSLALEARGFSPGGKRAMLSKPRFTTLDVVLLAGLGAVLVLSVIWRLTGHGASIPSRI